jgi:hypothetical protein
MGGTLTLPEGGEKHAKWLSIDRKTPEKRPLRRLGIDGSTILKRVIRRRLSDYIWPRTMSNGRDIWTYCITEHFQEGSRVYVPMVSAAEV